MSFDMGATYCDSQAFFLFLRGEKCDGQISDRRLSCLLSLFIERNDWATNTATTEDMPCRESYVLRHVLHTQEAVVFVYYLIQLF